MTPREFAERCPSAAAVVQQGIERGFHHGAQVYVSLAGNLVADVGVGFAAPETPMTADTLNPWLSAGKPLTAVLIGQLVDAGRLDWNDRVAQHLPEFGQAGKEAITLRHLLTHTAGIGAINTGWPAADWNESLARICSAPLDPEWTIGETAGYDPGASWFLLGEIVQRLTGQSFVEALTDRLLKPFGMHRTWAAVPLDQLTGLRSELGWLWERQRGTLVPLDWHEPPRCTRPSPGASLRGPVRDLGRFYESLLKDRRDVPSLADMTSRQRVGRFDQTLGHIVDFGLGFLIDSNQYGAETVPYGYGRFCSPRTFGHGGAQCSQGYCDPDRDLVVAYVFNGRPGEGQHQRRARAFNDAIYADLGLSY